MAHSRLYSAAAPVFFIYPIFFSFFVIRPLVSYSPSFFFCVCVPLFFLFVGGVEIMQSTRVSLFFLSPLFFILRWIRGGKGEVHPGCYRSVRLSILYDASAPLFHRVSFPGVLVFRLCFFALSLSLLWGG